MPRNEDDEIESQEPAEGTEPADEGNDQGGGETEQPQRQPIDDGQEQAQQQMSSRRGNGGSQQRPSKWGSQIKSLKGNYDTLTKQNSELVQQIAELRGMLQASRQQQAPTPGESPRDQQLKSIRSQMNQLVALSGNSSLSDQDRRAMAEQFTALQAQEAQLREESMMERLVEKMRASQPQQHPQTNVYSQVIAAEFPRLVGNGKATAMARTYYEQLVAERGGQESIDLLREACAWAYATFSLGQSRPTNGDRAAFSGTRGAGAQANGNSVTIDPRMRELMRYAGVSEDQVRAQLDRESQ